MVLTLSIALTRPRCVCQRDLIETVRRFEDVHVYDDSLSTVNYFSNLLIFNNFHIYAMYHTSYTVWERERRGKIQALVV